MLANLLVYAHDFSEFQDLELVPMEGSLTANFRSIGQSPAATRFL